MGKRSMRVHVTGGAGSGKTHFAHRLATARSIPHRELDYVLMTAEGQAEQIDAPAVLKMANVTEWVSDGVFFGWARPFLEGAHTIVWLDVPWRVASYRLVTRHLRLEVTRKNPHPGWRHFYKFWRSSAAFYADRADGRVDRFGFPTTRATLATLLLPYADKVVVCRTGADVTQMLAELSDGTT